MQQQIETTEKMYIAADGSLKEQSLFNYDRHLSHIARQRANSKAVAASIAYLLGISIDAYEEFKIEMLKKFLMRLYEGSPMDAESVAYATMANAMVRGWWNNHFYKIECEYIEHLWEDGKTTFDLAQEKLDKYRRELDKQKIAQDRLRSSVLQYIEDYFFDADGYETLLESYFKLV